jgi:hypothetical protein
MAPTIAAAHLFATARLFVTGRIFIEAERILVKREATWFDKTFLCILYAKKDTKE